MTTEDRSSSAVSLALGRMVAELAGVSDRGAVRTENQDAWALATTADGRQCVMILADGMGGHRGGYESAHAAVNGAIHAVEEIDDPAAGINDIVAAASRGVAGVRDVIGGEPGTTLVVAVLGDGLATIGNVGDSRAYLVRGGRATPITTDHSWAAEQVAAGAMSAGDARHDRRRNIVTRAVLGDQVAPDVFPVTLEAGDVLVLCTDGAWEPLEDGEIAGGFTSPEPLSRLVERACDAALAAGSTDNVTIVAARVAR